MSSLAWRLQGSLLFVDSFCFQNLYRDGYAGTDFLQSASPSTSCGVGSADVAKNNGDKMQTPHDLMLSCPYCVGVGS